jgi:hypothetical protein
MSFSAHERIYIPDLFYARSRTYLGNDVVVKDDRITVSKGLLQTMI